MSDEPVAQDEKQTAKTAEADSQPAEQQAADTGADGVESATEGAQPEEGADAAETEATEAAQETAPESAEAVPDTAAAPPTVSKVDIAMPEDRILDPSKLIISRGPDGHARLEIQGDRCILLMRAVRLFPISHRRGFIVLSDANNDEVGIIRDLRALPRAMRHIVLEELRKRYFVPQITYVYSLKDEYGVLYWDVETTRGARQFVVRDVRDNIREFPGGRMQITDVDGNEFEIANIDALPGKGVSDLYRLL